MQQIRERQISDNELFKFRRALRTLERNIAGQLKDETVCCGVTSAQCHTILELEVREHAAVSELAGFFGLDRSTLSRTVDGLVSAGLVNRIENPDDRRYSLITLTPQGMEKVSLINRLCNESYLDLFRYIPKEKHAGVIESAELLADAMEKLRENRAPVNNSPGEEKNK